MKACEWGAGVIGLTRQPLFTQVSCRQRRHRGRIIRLSRYEWEDREQESRMTRGTIEQYYRTHCDSSGYRILLRAPGNKIVSKKEMDRPRRTLLKRAQAQQWVPNNMQWVLFEKRAKKGEDSYSSSSRKNFPSNYGGFSVIEAHRSSHGVAYISNGMHTIGRHADLTWLNSSLSSSKRFSKVWSGYNFQTRVHGGCGMPNWIWSRGSFWKRKDTKWHDDHLRNGCLAWRAERMRDCDWRKWDPIVAEMPSERQLLEGKQHLWFYV